MSTPPARDGPSHPRLARHLARLTESLGLGRWHPHELRHSAVSLLSSAGVRLEDVADVVGHVSTRMMQQVYRHQVAPTIGAGRAAMESMFGGQVGGQLGVAGGTDTAHED